MEKREPREEASEKEASITAEPEEIKQESEPETAEKPAE